jgi:hypothetical protein
LSKAIANNTPVLSRLLSLVNRVQIQPSPIVFNNSNRQQQ